MYCSNALTLANTLTGKLQKVGETMVQHMVAMGLNKEIVWNLLPGAAKPSLITREILIVFNFTK